MQISLLMMRETCPIETLRESQRLLTSNGKCLFSTNILRQSRKFFGRFLQRVCRLHNNLKPKIEAHITDLSYLIVVLPDRSLFCMRTRTMHAVYSSSSSSFGFFLKPVAPAYLVVSIICLSRSSSATPDALAISIIACLSVLISAS